MSLLRNVLEGFDGGTTFGQYTGISNGPAMDFSITNAALLETMSTIIDTERVSNSADIMAAMKVVIEGADVSATMEGFFSDVISKLKGAFEKLKKTIKKWFDEAVKFFQSMFKSGKDFVDSYGDELRAKSTAGFEYIGYEWNEKKGTALVEKIYGVIDNEINGMIGDLAKAAEMTSDELSGKMKKTNDGDSGYADDIVIKCGVGANNVTQMKDEIKKAYHNGMDDPASDATLSSGQVSEYLSWVGTGKDIIAKVKKDQTAFESRLNSIISTLDGIAKKEDKEGDKSKNATACSKCLTTLLSVKKSAADTKVECLRNMLRAETAILKKFLHWGGKKEAVQNSVEHDLAEMEMLEALYPELLPDTIMEEGLEVVQVDDYSSMESSFDNNNSGNSLFDQVSAMLGI